MQARDRPWLGDRSAVSSGVFPVCSRTYTGYVRGAVLIPPRKAAVPGLRWKRETFQNIRIINRFDFYAVIKAVGGTIAIAALATDWLEVLGRPRHCVCIQDGRLCEPVTGFSQMFLVFFAFAIGTAATHRVSLS